MDTPTRFVSLGIFNQCDRYTDWSFRDNGPGHALRQYELSHDRVADTWSGRLRRSETEADPFDDGEPLDAETIATLRAIVQSL